MGPCQLGQSVQTEISGGTRSLDPGKLNNTMGENIWWRWLKTPAELWAKLWKQKYTLNTPQAQLIRLTGQIQGLTYGTQLGKIDANTSSCLLGN
jgi:hypothetical protein